MKVASTPDPIPPDMSRPENVPTAVLGILLLFGMLAILFPNPSSSLAERSIWGLPLILLGGCLVLLPMVIREHVSRLRSRFYTRLSVAMVVSLLLILVVLPLTGIDPTLQIADPYTYSGTHRVANPQYVWPMAILGMAPACTVVLAQLLGFTAEARRSRSHSSPSNDTILLDALGTSDQLARRGNKRTALHEPLFHRHGEKAISVPRSILGALDASASDTRTLRPILDGIYVATGLQETSTSLYVIEASTINGAIWGGEPQGVHVAITRGALQRLDRTELEAVLMNLMLRQSRLLEITGSTMYLLQPHQPAPGATSWDYPLKLREQSLSLLFDADQRTTHLLRNPAVILRVFCTLQKTGAAIGDPRIAYMHPGHFFVWPWNHGAPFDRQLRDRMERLHRVLEVKERSGEHLR